MINYPILAMSLCVAAITVLRFMRLPPGRLFLWEFNQRVGGFLLVAITSFVYSFQRPLNSVGPPWSIGTVAFHVLMVLMGGSLEMILHSLRREEVSQRSVRRVTVRAGVIFGVLLMTWVLGFSQHQIENLFSLRDQPFIRVYGVIFHAYMVWVLVAVVRSFGSRALEARVRRPIKAASYLFVAAGCACFTVINLIHLAAWVLGFVARPEVVSAGSPVYFGLIVVGLILVGVGEPLANEFQALRQLRTILPLWRRLSELSSIGLLPPGRIWSAQVRLQRGWAEIADALASLAPTEQIEPTPGGVALAIHSGKVTPLTAVGARLSLAETLPVRVSRRDDREVMDEIATEYKALRGDQPRGMNVQPRGSRPR